MNTTGRRNGDNDRTWSSIPSENVPVSPVSPSSGDALMSLLNTLDTKQEAKRTVRWSPDVKEPRVTERKRKVKTGGPRRNMAGGLQDIPARGTSLVNVPARMTSLALVDRPSSGDYDAQQSPSREKRRPRQSQVPHQMRVVHSGPALPPRPSSMQTNQQYPERTERKSSLESSGITTSREVPQPRYHHTVPGARRLTPPESPKMVRFPVPKTRKSSITPSVETPSHLKTLEQGPLTPPEIYIADKVPDLQTTLFSYPPREVEIELESDNSVSSSPASEDENASISEEDDMDNLISNNTPPQEDQTSLDRAMRKHVKNVVYEIPPSILDDSALPDISQTPPIPDEPTLKHIPMIADIPPIPDLPPPSIPLERELPSIPDEINLVVKLIESVRSFNVAKTFTYNDLRLLIREEFEDEDVLLEKYTLMINDGRVNSQAAWKDLLDVIKYDEMSCELIEEKWNFDLPKMELEVSTVLDKEVPSEFTDMFSSW